MGKLAISRWWFGYWLGITSFMLLAPTAFPGDRPAPPRQPRVVTSPPYATTGILNHHGKVEVSTTFNLEIDLDTARAMANYTIDGGAGVEALRVVPHTGAIILSCTNLQTTGHNLTLQHLKDLSGNSLPPQNVRIVPNDRGWVEIGGDELGLYSEAIAIGEDGFDLISGGVQTWNLYDEATFAYRQVIGDFTATIRVQEQAPSSRCARAGLMVREFLDDGRPRPANPSDPAQGFSRYLDLHVNPATQADGSPANNTHEVSLRAYPGGIGRPPFQEPTVNPTLSENAPPAYPDAWLRIRRQGQTFTAFRSSNGEDWTELGTFSFPATDFWGNSIPPLPAALYVGPMYSPENGNIPNSALRTSYLARFRDFTIEASATPGQLTVIRLGPEVEISWTGTGILQTSETLLPDSWIDLPQAATPWRVDPDGTHAFYRLKQ